MNETVVTMSGKPVHQPGVPIPGIVSMLEAMLAEARSGNMRAIAIAYVLKPDSSTPIVSNQFEFEGGTARDIWYAIGKMDRRIGRWIDEL